MIKQTTGILGLALAMCLFVQCKDNKTANTAGAGTAENSELLPIAYVDMDSLLAHFEFYNQLAKSYEDKLLSRNNAINSGYQKLQNEAINFQQKAQNNAFLNQERAMQEQTRIQRMEEDLKKSAAQMEQELAIEQQQLQQQLADTLKAGIKKFNTPQKYQVILQKSGLLYADEGYDVTTAVLEYLNKNIKPVEKK
jgi:outer membrane protein